MKWSINSILVLITALAYILLTIGLFTAWLTPATGFEPSIYLSTPFIFWLSILFSYVVSFCLIFCHILKYHQSRLLLGSAYLLLLLTVISITSLFIIRNQGVLGIIDDPGTHVGNIQALFNSGFTSSIYPATYIETVSASLLTGLDLKYMMNVHTVVFVLVLIGGITLLGRRICRTKNEQFFVILIACLFPFGSNLYMTGGFSFSTYIPYISAFQFMPLFMYLVYTLLESEKYRGVWLLVAVFFLTFILFGHMLTFVILMLFLGCVFIQQILFSDVPLLSNRNLRTVVILIITAGIIFLIYTWMMYALQRPLLNIVELFLGETTASYTSQVASESSILFDRSIFEIISIGIRYAGLMGISCLFILITAVYLLHSGKRKQYANLHSLYLMILPIILLFGVSFIAFLGFQPGRMMVYVSLCGIFAISIFLAYNLQLVQKKQTTKRKILCLSIIVAVLVSVGFLGCMSYYTSYHIGGSMSSQQTLSAANGMDFYFTTANLDYDLIGIGVSPGRWQKYLYASSYVLTGNKDRVFQNYADSPADHFGYSESDVSLSSSVGGQTYMGVSIRGLENYKANTVLWDETHIPRFIDEDFVQLNMDSSVCKIFQSPGMEWYSIY